MHHSIDRKVHATVFAILIVQQCLKEDIAFLGEWVGVGLTQTLWVQQYLNTYVLHYVKKRKIEGIRR